jgi:hypothetical protein
MIFRFLLVIYLITTTLTAYAIREPRATSIDSRIRVLVYHPNDVFKYTGYYGYQGSIQLNGIRLGLSTLITITCPFTHWFTRNSLIMPIWPDLLPNS